jgi:hypothetical protein
MCTIAGHDFICRILLSKHKINTKVAAVIYWRLLMGIFLFLLYLP